MVLKTGFSDAAIVDHPLNTERVRGSRFPINPVNVTKGIPVLESLKGNRSNHPSIEEEDGTEDMEVEDTKDGTTSKVDNATSNKDNSASSTTAGEDETEDEESAIFV